MLFLKKTRKFTDLQESKKDSNDLKHPETFVFNVGTGIFHYSKKQAGFFKISAILKQFFRSEVEAEVKCDLEGNQVELSQTFVNFSSRMCKLSKLTLHANFMISKKNQKQVLIILELAFFQERSKDERVLLHFNRELMIVQFRH